MTELLGYAIIGIEAEKAEEFFSVMKETQTLLREQMNTIKTNNELLKGLEQRHDSVYSVLKDVGTLPESIELALSEKITRMESQNTTRQQALMRVEGILDELGSIALGEGKVFRSRPLLKNIVTSRIVKRIKK